MIKRLGLILVFSCVSLVFAVEQKQKSFVNSIGMEMIRIEPGTFKMGQLDVPLPEEVIPFTNNKGDRMDFLEAGDFDEKPVHTVTISKTFYIGAYEVTNFQYEQFDPSHSKLRGKYGYSTDDKEAVIYVNWYDAQAFCRWLSEKEGKAYRLATEAEWEYSCRAGTTSNYHTGDMLSEDFYKHADITRTTVQPPVGLHTGKTAPNVWGLYDMHGNVEEWCSDWYGSYKPDEQVDPVGYADGDFKVLRGGSHSTHAYYLRSANRMGALLETRNILTGFRVVLGETPTTQGLPVPPAPLNQQDVISRDISKLSRVYDPAKPYFRGPVRYVIIPPEASGPLYSSHNHDPAIVECPNGDILAMWYTCVSERNRELGQAASRLRWGETQWEPASLFWNVPDRNNHAPAMWFDGRDTIYHFTGVSLAGNYSNLAGVMRTSSDSGATWSKARLILPEFDGEHQISESVIRLQDGGIALTVDGKRTLWISRDEGLTWTNPGGRIIANHPGVVQLKDGRLLGFGREGDIDGQMPMSISSDVGRSFSYSPSIFAPIGGGQRLAMTRLKEGPIFFASFATERDMVFTDNAVKRFNFRGLFAAVSLDEGQTWSYIKPVNREDAGYLSVCQGLDGLIHLISSKNHYAFNLEWLKSPPAPPEPEPSVTRIVETFNGLDDFDNEGWTNIKCNTAGFNGKGSYTIESNSRNNGIGRLIGKGSFEALYEFDNIRFNPPRKRTMSNINLGFRFWRSRKLTLFFCHDHIQVELKDNENPAGFNYDTTNDVRYPIAPKSLRLKVTWSEKNRQWRIFYGFNGHLPNTELPQSKAGMFFGPPITGELNHCFIQVTTGTADLVHFEVNPVAE